MGFLTDPNADNSKLTKNIVKHYRKLCVILYFGGILYFSVYCVLTCEKPYFTHNAFLTGIASIEFNSGQLANTYHNELLKQIEANNNLFPHSWLVSKFQELGIEAFIHNFTINHPLNQNRKIKGSNIYAILRTPRGYSNEAIVLSAPVRLPSAETVTTTPSIAFLLTYAQFAKNKNYIAKDIIFLLTEHDELGAQAWLESYHEITMGHSGVVETTPLSRRSGFILSALNVELHDVKIGHVDVKIEGLNGAMPNLDLFDATIKMLKRRRVPQTFKNRSHEDNSDNFKQWWAYIQTVSTMILSQASGLPNGNHGVFLNFGIHALTIQGYSSSNRDGVGFNEIGCVVEAVLRSLNNMVQRFHQSFFFYLLTSTERFIPIGMYIPAVAMIAGALFIKAFAKWMQLQSKRKEEGDRSSHINILSILAVFAATHILGFLIMNSPKFIATKICGLFSHSLDLCLFFTFAAISLLLLLIPRLVPFTDCGTRLSILNILSLLELGTVLVCAAMTNISLAFYCSILYAPWALAFGPTRSTFSIFLLRTIWLIVHPIVALSIVVGVRPLLAANHFHLANLFSMHEAFAASIEHNIIYGHWLFTVFTIVFLPNWLCFWIVSFAKIKKLKQE